MSSNDQREMMDFPHGRPTPQRRGPYGERKSMTREQQTVIYTIGLLWERIRELEDLLDRLAPGWDKQCNTLRQVLHRRHYAARN